VEGVGGWMVPITPEYFSNDLAADLRLPVIVIAHNRLGCLNHILLTVRCIQSAGLRCAGVVLNDLTKEVDTASTTNAEILQRCLTLPILPRFDSESDEIAPSLREMLPKIGQRL
jgi:dethiobiotin synthetase